MMLKRVFCLILLILIGFTGFAQESVRVFDEIEEFEDFVVDAPTNPRLDKRMNSGCIPNANTPVKYIRVVFHFMLDNNGHGNFTATGNDGGITGSIANGHTGLWYVQEIVKTANQRLATNYQMNLPPNNNTPALDPKYRLVIEDIYYRKDSANCVFRRGSSVPSLYSANKGSAINVFFCQKDFNDTAGGYANMSGNRYVVMNGCWDKYRVDFTAGYHLWVIAGSLNHEIGHNLNLLHTMRLNHGPCSDTHDDGCTDTPTRIQMINQNGQDPCCGWGGGSNSLCTNNLMDYSGSHALTPQQLGRVHYCLENDMPNYYQESSISRPAINGTTNCILTIKPGQSIILDGGTNSFTQNNLYFVSIQRSDAHWNRYGTAFGGWLTASQTSQIKAFNLRSYCAGRFSLVEGYYYKVTLAVNPWHARGTLIYLEKSPTPPPPPPGPTKPTPIDLGWE